MFNSAIASLSSTVTWQNNFLLHTLVLFWCIFPFSTCITENPWVAKQLLLITKVGWDKSYPKRVNHLSRRKSWGSAGACIQPSLLSMPHLLPCATPHRFVTSASPEHSPWLLLAAATARPFPRAIPLFPHPSLSALPAASISTQEQALTTAFHSVTVTGVKPIFIWN